MAENFELTEALNAKVGWESQPWTFEVTTTSIRAFARGVGYTDPVYFDVDAAKKAGYRNLPAPPTYLGTAVFSPEESHDNLPYPIAFKPNLEHGLSNLLDGGTEIEVFESICAGDELTCVNKLMKLETKKSRSLRIMLIASSKANYTNQHGKLAAVQHSQAIYY